LDPVRRHRRGCRDPARGSRRAQGPHRACLQAPHHPQAYRLRDGIAPGPRPAASPARAGSEGRACGAPFTPPPSAARAPARSRSTSPRGPPRTCPWWAGSARPRPRRAPTEQPEHLVALGAFFREPFPPEWPEARLHGGHVAGERVERGEALLVVLVERAV